MLRIGMRYEQVLFQFFDVCRASKCIYVDDLVVVDIVCTMLQDNVVSEDGSCLSTKIP